MLPNLVGGLELAELVEPSKKTEVDCSLVVDRAKQCRPFRRRHRRRRRHRQQHWAVRSDCSAYWHSPLQLQRVSQQWLIMLTWALRTVWNRDKITYLLRGWHFLVALES
jgi:hypothetical protein